MRDYDYYMERTYGPQPDEYTRAEQVEMTLRRWKRFTHAARAHIKEARQTR